MGQRTFNYDNNLLLKDAYLVAASAAAQVASADKVLDLGGTGSARMEGTVVIDVSAIEIASNDEEYDIILQGSTTSGFTAGTIQNLAQMNLGATEVRQGAAIDSTTGRYEMPFTNEQDDVTYRYVRLYTVVAGTIAGGGGLNYKAFIALAPGS
jgi:hypothetical protein